MNMNANESYEVKAEAFRMMTGQMAPGKDPPRGSYPEPLEKRSVLWSRWKFEYGEIIHAMEVAFERIMGDV